MFLKPVMQSLSPPTRLPQLLKRCFSTIFALSTPLQDTGSAIAVFRVSGSGARLVLQEMTTSNKNKWIEKPRTAILTKLVDPKTKQLIDQAIVIWFPKPNSYTGEDLCELHVHGSWAIASALYKAFGQLEGLRPAEPGEFTKRAFLNGKMDLIEAEGIGDLIEARTEAQRRRALDALSGKVLKMYEEWRKRIIEAMAFFEANIDFGEDELIEEETLVRVKVELEKLISDIDSHLKKSVSRSSLIKQGLQVSIIGHPNAGKSTLINLLSQRDLSIVSPISGTTRDVVETWLNVAGHAVRLSDTAGLRTDPVGDQIEEEGIRRAIQRARESEIILLVIDATQISISNGLVPKEVQTLVQNAKVLFIINKVDLLNEETLKNLSENCDKEDTCFISCKTQYGIEIFLRKFSQNIENVCGAPSEENLFLTERHQIHLTKTCQLVERALSVCEEDVAIGAHHLRHAANQLAQISGKITTDDILDVIFKNFCIGK